MPPPTSTGVATFSRLLPGPYRVSAADSAFVALDLSLPTAIRFRAARDTLIEVGGTVRTAAETVERSCRDRAVWTPGSYALVVRVVRVVNPDGTPVAGAGWSVSVGRTTGVTGSDGMFQYCFGLDLGMQVKIAVARGHELPGSSGPTRRTMVGSSSGSR